MPGTLFVVATPIGNLEDLTLRALRTLREVDLIAAEDTRRTAKLLARYEIRKPVVSLREHNEVRETPRLIARLTAGTSVALVSDAGTPAISDPGARLVRAARETGLPVVAIPGPSAIIAALSVSGLECSEFVFMGFPPRAGRERTEWMSRFSAETRPIVFFESPHRLRRTLDEVMEVKRQIFIHNEITKINEKFVICTNTQPYTLSTERGEFTLVVPSSPVDGDAVDEMAVYSLYSALVSGNPVPREEAIRIASAACGVSKQDAKKIVKKRTISAKQQNDASA